MEHKGLFRGKMDTDKGQGRLWLFLAVSAGCLLLGVWAFVQASPIKEKLFGSAGRAMLGETLVFFFWQTACFCLPCQEKKRGQKKRLRAAGIILGLGIGLWCHQILLPFLVSGVWLLGLFLLGDVLFCRWKDKEESLLFWLSSRFLTGAGGWISLVCVLSAFGIGGISRIRIIAAGVVLAVILETGKNKRTGVYTKKKVNCLWEQDRIEGLFLAVIVTMVFVQLARINLTPDYDSLHYGLRSPYILDGGRGIYENLGNINLVYTYPKGLEILTFPLSGTTTYGYQLCFNIWMSVLAVVLAGVLVSRLGGGRREAFFAAMLVSLIPGVMNMGITAKSDLLTLVCQLLLLLGAVEIFRCPLKREKGRWFGISLAACLLSFSMKPTALVFSTVLSLCCLGALGKNGGFSTADFSPVQESKAESGKEGMAFSWLSVLFCAGAWLGTWLRTWNMTGVPTTSVFTSIWEKLGFSVKWPYAFSALPSQGLEIGGIQGAVFLLRRLAGVLFAPIGDDMFHVRLAWGSCVPALCLLAWLLWGIGKEKEKSCLKASVGGIGLISLFSLFLLWQVDGNYYMLLYVLLAITGVLSLEQAFFFSSPGVNRISAKTYGEKWGTGLVFSGFLLVQTGLILGSNWAGTTGFTPIKLVHPGFVNHQQQRFQEKSETGNQEIWAILSQNPRTRVIAVGEHPGVLQFPCNVQSYYDVTGSGGNVRLVKTLEDFKKFLRFAQTEYLYVEAGYLEKGSRAYDVVRYLIEEGSLGEIQYAYGNMLGRINLEGEIPVNPKEETERFYQQIKVKEGS